MQQILAAIGALGLILGSSGGVSPLQRAAPAQQHQDAWMLEIGNGDNVLQGDMLRHNRFFIHPQPLDPENPPQGIQLNQWFVSWEENGDDNFLCRFYYTPQGFDGPPTPEMLEQAEKTLLREFEIRPQVKVFLTELKEYGFQPVTLRLARPVTDRMPIPPVVIETPSLELVGLEPGRNRWQLKLANRSSKALIALAFGGGPCSHSTHASLHQPLIRAGEERAVACRIEPPLAEGVPPHGEIVIESAFFEDYSYEGDVRFARGELARLSGARQGLPVLIAAIRKALQQNRDQEVGKVLQTLLKGLKREKIQELDDLATEFAELDGDAAGKGEWLQRLHQGAWGVFQMFAREMEWNTRRLIDTGGSKERFWQMLESRQARLSEWLARLEESPPGALY